MSIRPSGWTQWVVWPLAGLSTGIVVPTVIIFGGAAATADPELGVGATATYLFLILFYFGVWFIPLFAFAGGVAGELAAALWSLLRLWRNERARRVVSGAACTAILIAVVMLFGHWILTGPLEGFGTDPDGLPVWWVIVLVITAVAHGASATALVAWSERRPRIAATAPGEQAAAVPPGDGMLP